MSSRSLRRGYRRRNRDQKLAGTAIAAGLMLALAHSHPSAAPSTAHLAAAGVAGGSETAFTRAVLTDLGAPVTQAGVASLTSWFPREFPSWPPAAGNNPMASTLRTVGSTTYNSVGVQNYPSASVGADATARTLNNGHYPGIVAGLRSGRGLCGQSLSGEFLTWSGGGYSGVC